MFILLDWEMEVGKGSRKLSRLYIDRQMCEGGGVNKINEELTDEAGC